MVIFIKSALIKDVFREIKNSRNRFISIFAIIALGAGFFAGLKVTYPDMLATMDKYYSEQNLMDIHLVSILGFDEDDISAIRSENGIKDLYPTYSKDVFIHEDGDSDLVAKLMAFPDSGVNSVVILEGRAPENSGECLVESNSQLPVQHNIGDTVSVYTTDPDDPIGDSLSKTEWKVVGTFMSPQYVAFDRGTSTIGDGRTDIIIMVPEENFSLEVYTDVYITLDSTKGLSAFSDEYASAVEIALEDFEKIGDERAPLRLSEIKDEAYAEINDAKAEIADAEKELADAEEELADAFSELTDGEKELADGWEEYYDGLKEYNDGVKEFSEEIEKAEKDLANGIESIRNGYSQYEKGFDEYNKGKTEFDASLAAYGKTIEEFYETRGQLEGFINQYEKIPGMESAVSEMKANLAQVNFVIGTHEQLEAAGKELEKAKAKLESGGKQLTAGRKELEEAKKEAEEEFSKAEKELADAFAELKDAEKELADGWEEYNAGLEEFEEVKAEAEIEIADAKAEIADAEEELSELNNASWYVFDRNDNPGYSIYETNAYIVENVGKVFPLFFFLVAMLVCLTTMTRMVEEKRTETGTLKALGYGKGAALSKYLVYAILASISGAVFGIALCVYVFPTIIHFAYGIAFILPKLQHVAMPGTWLLTILVCILCTSIAVLIAGYYELRENPAELMRPKAPKIGKRVLLEKIPFIWKRLNFNRKVTVRNLFRYKKRMFMTILGIAGCAALTITGFGIFSSLSVIIENQYSEIFNYDLLVSLDTDSGEEEISSVLEELDENEISENNFPLHIMSAKYEWLGNTNLMTVSDVDEFEKFILLRNLETGEKIELTDEGIVITERFAQIFGLLPGDEITFYCEDKEFTAKITGVAEHYAMHFIYMTEELYQKLSGEKPEINAVITTLSDSSEESREALAKTLTEHDGVLALSFSQDEMENFSKTIENMNYVVILIIACAAALAFIVLYNLTNVNIMERIREIATIKVLGFRNGEVDSYVFRENVILSVIGALVGLLLGRGLFAFILGAIQSSDIMFVEHLPFWCYAVSFIMTIVFTYIVNGIMHFRLKRVNMVESLKSIE